MYLSQKHFGAPRLKNPEEIISHSNVHHKINADLMLSNEDSYKSVKSREDDTFSSDDNLPPARKPMASSMIVSPHNNLSGKKSQYRSKYKANNENRELSLEHFNELRDVQGENQYREMRNSYRPNHLNNANGNVRIENNHVEIDQHGSVLRDTGFQTLMNRNQAHLLHESEHR